MSAQFAKIWRFGTAVGLSRGSSVIRAVRLSKSPDGVRIQGAAGFDLPLDRPPHPSEIEEAINKVCEGLVDEKVKVVTNISDRLAGCHLFDIPFNQPEKVQRVLRYNAEPLFLTPVDDMVLDYMPLAAADPDESKPGVVFGAGQETVTDLLQNLGEIGLEPEYIIPDRLGLILTGQYLLKNHIEEPLHLMVDLGSDKTGLCLFENGRLALTRSILYGGNEITRSFAEELEQEQYDAELMKRTTSLVEDEDEDTWKRKARTALIKAWNPLLLEIERSLASILLSRNDAITPVMILCGGGAAAPGLDRFLTEQLGMDVRPLSAFTSGETGLRELTPEMATAFGLALLHLESGYKPNLRQGEHAPRRIFNKYRNAVLAMAAGIILTLVFHLGAVWYAGHFEESKHQKIKNELNKIYMETLNRSEKVQTPFILLEQAVDNLRMSSSSLNPGQQRALEVLLDLSRITGGHKGLRITSLVLNRKGLELQGEGGSFESIDILKTELGELEYISEVILGGARVDPNTKVLTFKISLKRKAG